MPDIHRVSSEYLAIAVAAQTQHRQHRRALDIDAALARRREDNHVYAAAGKFTHRFERVSLDTTNIRRKLRRDHADVHCFSFRTSTSGCKESHPRGGTGSPASAMALLVGLTTRNSAIPAPQRSIMRRRPSASGGKGA